MASQTVIIMSAAFTAVIILPMIVIFSSSVYYLWCCKSAETTIAQNGIECGKEELVDDSATINESISSDYEPPFTIQVVVNQRENYQQSTTEP